VADTYTGSLNVKPTPELNPFLSTAVFRGIDFSVAFCENEKPKTPTIAYEDAQKIDIITARIDNRGDETIEAYFAYRIDKGAERRLPVYSIVPGSYAWEQGHLPSGAMSVGKHTIWYVLRARTPSGSFKDYLKQTTTYTVSPVPCTCTAWVNRECTAAGKRRQTRTCIPPGCDIEERIIADTTCRPFGDITKVELDSQLLPEGGTLDWVRTEEATIKVYFKNTGNVASKFHIWVTDEDGATLCDVTTSTEIPADNVERYVTCGSFTPTEVEKKTLTAHIEP